MDRYNILLEKAPSKKESGPCPWCGHNESYCGRIIHLQGEKIVRGSKYWSETLGCTREAGHPGPHVACSKLSEEHGIKTWRRLHAGD
jgi:hypothetical protein